MINMEQMKARMEEELRVVGKFEDQKAPQKRLAAGKVSDKGLAKYRFKAATLIQFDKLMRARNAPGMVSYR